MSFVLPDLSAVAVGLSALIATSFGVVRIFNAVRLPVSHQRKSLYDALFDVLDNDPGQFVLSAAEILIGIYAYTSPARACFILSAWMGLSSIMDVVAVMSVGLVEGFSTIWDGDRTLNRKYSIGVRLFYRVVLQTVSTIGLFLLFCESKVCWCAMVEFL